MPSPRGGVPGGDPSPGQPLLRAVRTLLECILVYMVNITYQYYEDNPDVEAM